MKYFETFNLPLKVLVIFFILMSCGESTEKSSRVAYLPYYGEATFTPQWLEADNPALDTFHRISAFDLTNQDGQTISQKDFDGKIYVTDFFFTICPGICPKMTANFAMVQDEFINDKDVLLLSHSVTPERDSVSVLKTYAREKGVVSGKWHLVTGDRNQIYKLGRQSYFVEEDLGLLKDPEEFLHTENFVLIDRNRFIRGIYNGLNKASVQQLMADIRTLKRE